PYSSPRTSAARLHPGHIAQWPPILSRNLLRPFAHSSRWQRHRDELSARRGATPGRPADHNLSADPVDRFRRHDFLDGRFSPLLRAAEKMGTAEGKNDRLFASHSCRTAKDLLPS